MQTILPNVFMPKKDKFNLSLPPALMKQFEEIAADFGNKVKGEVFAAAMLNFLAISREERGSLINQCILASANRNNYDALIAAAKFNQQRGPLPSIPPDANQFQTGPEKKPAAKERETANATRAGRSK